MCASYSYAARVYVVVAYCSTCVCWLNYSTLQHEHMLTWLIAARVCAGTSLISMKFCVSLVALYHPKYYLSDIVKWQLMLLHLYSYVHDAWCGGWVADYNYL